MTNQTFDNYNKIICRADIKQGVRDHRRVYVTAFQPFHPALNFVYFLKSKSQRLKIGRCQCNAGHSPEQELTAIYQFM